VEARFVTEDEVRRDTLDAAATPAEPSGAPAAPEAMSALAQLFAQHADGLVRGLTAAGYPDASDAVQEAFVQAVVHWRRVGRYDDPLVWIRRVAVNKARNRSRSRRRQASLKERLGQTASRVVGVRELPDDDVLAAVAALPSQQRLVVSLFYYSDLSVAQAAAAMGISEGTVKSHLHAARAAVAHILEVAP
jgi:RNA polymerase sigma-70 factor (ECF subfamily)